MEQVSGIAPYNHINSLTTFDLGFLLLKQIDNNFTGTREIT